jgi:alpha-beta hydrolase superfamily lysophospholipase
MKILFLHGWGSVTGGVKPSYLARHGHEVLNPALPDDDFEASVRIAQELIDREQPSVIVGSSRGGAVAMNVKPRQSQRLVLLCPRLEALGDRENRSARDNHSAFTNR